jgi:hypothetical protein
VVGERDEDDSTERHAEPGEESIMLILRTTLTRPLGRWLRESHDDGCAPLKVEQVGADIEVLRADGSALSADETIEVRARLAANAVKPLK